MRPFCVVLCCLLAVPLAQAQQPAAPAAPPPSADTAAPPYERQLLRLAEILGALSFLRDICGDNDSAEWRQRMAALIDAEGVTDARKERLAGAYNRGFRSYETIYRNCTPNAELAITRYLDEGQKIVRDVASRYGG